LSSLRRVGRLSISLQTYLLVAIANVRGL